ncbi:MAG: histidine phosphatase family protein [Actinobacteria bacterium]|nr:histidine phosphatase family protein [Actinomycetota bacterium]
MSKLLESKFFRYLALLIATTLLASIFPQVATAKNLLIWDKLQGTNPKGYVLLMRHALAPGIGDPENFQVGDCKTQRNLSDEGRQDARDVGDWLERQDVKIRSIESSRWCRAKETAELLDIGTVKLNRHLDSLFQESDLVNHKQTIEIKKRIVSHRSNRGLLVFVGHLVNITALTGVSLGSGEGVLVRANTKGEIKVKGYSPSP